MKRLFYLLLRPPLSADLEIMACSTTPPLLLLRPLVSLLGSQQRRTVLLHHFQNSSSDPVQGHDQIPLFSWAQAEGQGESEGIVAF